MQKNLKNYKLCLSATTPHMYLLIVANTIVTALLPFIEIFFPREIISELMGKGRPEFLVLLLVSFFVCGAVGFYLTEIFRASYLPLPVRATEPYMNMLYEKCLNVDFQCTENPEFLDELQTVSRGFGSLDHYSGMKGLMHKAFVLPGLFLTAIGFVGVIASLNMFILIYIFTNIFINYYVAFKERNIADKYKSNISNSERRSNYIYEVMSNFEYGKDIRLFDIANWLGERFLKCRDEHKKILIKIKKYEIRIEGVNILLALIREAVVYAYLAYLVIDGDISIADFTMYTSAILGFSVTVAKLAKNLSDIDRLNNHITEYLHFMERPNQIPRAKEPKPIPDSPYVFEFRNVSFSYPDNDTLVFENLNFNILPQEKVAIIGHNGAGKSTLVKLLLRLYDVNDGSILLNGVNIKDFDLVEYYSIFSVVFQEILPLAFSISENIALSSCLQSNEVEHVKKCILQAGLSEKIATLKNGLNTNVQKFMDNNGVSFSGGEAQKLMIARALYKDADMLVLDEPTASLDALAEKAIYEDFRNMTKEKTALFISHRLASTRFCDKILLFENGKIVEAGTHEELLRANGRYTELYKVQMQSYFKSNDVGD